MEPRLGETPSDVLREATPRRDDAIARGYFEFLPVKILRAIWRQPRDGRAPESVLRQIVIWSGLPLA